MSERSRQLEWETLCERLESRSSSLDAATLDRLNAARRQALAHAVVGRRTPARRWVAATAFAGLAALMFWPSAQELRVPPAPVSLDAFSLLASPDGVEMLESLDFYLWVKSQEQAADDRAG